MSQTTSTTEIFAAFQDYLTNDHDIREDIRTSVRELEQTAREVLTHLQSVHQPGGLKDLPTVCVKARELFSAVRDKIQVLMKKIPQGQYYRFHDHWRFVSQRLTFLAAFILYLESNKLITREETAELLGVSGTKEAGFHIDLDDYLIGLLQLASELSRFAVNSVTAGDYARPIMIAKFVGELDAGFRLLNLKNDTLRKRFDGLKYDLKKVEEVVYDLTIRGLRPQDDQSADSATGSQS